MDGYLQQLERIWPACVSGRIAAADGATAVARGLPVPVGAEVAIVSSSGRRLAADVIGFRGESAVLLPREGIRGVRPGDAVELVRTSDTLQLGPEWLGRVVSPLGEPLDGRGVPAGRQFVDCHRLAPETHQRLPIDEPWSTGVQAIDALLTCGRGQRIALIAGPGVGKSALLGMLARHSTADVNVVALIGERGREVNEFVQRDLRDGLSRSVVMAATSDQTAALRLRAAHAAIAVAEHFRDAGRHVLLLLDSLTRVCHSQREIGLAVGESAGRGGFPPSVLSLLPRLIERTGRTAAGSITAVFTVLVEQDDPSDPVGDAVRGLVDGHWVLSRRLAERGHYPAIDVLGSLSRLMPHLCEAGQWADAQLIRTLLAARREAADLIALGAYRRGASAEVDVALELEPAAAALLAQPLDEYRSFELARASLHALAEDARRRLQAHPAGAAVSAR